MSKAETHGSIRVIVRLAADDKADAAVDSDIMQSIRRAAVADKRERVRTSLLGTTHRIRRTFDDFPFLALETGPDGLRTLDSLQGIIIDVVEDQLHAPALLESAPLIQAEQAWAGGFDGLILDGSGTVVAVLDTGIDGGHPFLSGKIIEEACFSSTDPIFSALSLCPGGGETSTAAGSGVPCDAVGCDHGTHVAGIAVGNGQDGAVAPFSGIAKGANLMAVQVFSRITDPRICSGFGLAAPCALALTSDIMAALQRVFDLRDMYSFAVVNVSIGGGRFPSACDNKSPVTPMIDALRAAGIPTVVASGNDGFSNALSHPACISIAVSVGSTNDGYGGSTADRVTSFSNSAPFLSLLAPGYVITSSVPGGGYANAAGTSMAAPHVAGAFALLKQTMPSASVKQMLATLKSTGLPVRDGRNDVTKSRIRVLDALADLPTIRFKSATYTVLEKTGTAVITVTRTGLNNDVSTVQYSTSDGSGSAASDYTAQSGTLVFAAGDTSRSFNIHIIGDKIDEANETVHLTLNNAIGSLLGAQNTAVLTITDNDTGGALRFKSANYSISESGRMATITVTRSGGSAGGVTVDYATSDGTASGGSDYSATSGTLSFAAGQISKTFTIPVLNDTLDENNEVVNLRLSNPTGGAILAAVSTAVLTIVDDDSGGALRFSASAYNVNETGGLAAITVTRKGGTASGVTVGYSSGNGTAIAGNDYGANSGTLVFNAGETSKTFTIPIIDDLLAEGNETVALTLDGPTGGATLGSPATAVLTIADNEIALQFSSATYTVKETGITAIVTVTRSGPASAAVAVTYATSDGTALAGSDYTARLGTLSFAAGQTSKTFSIPIRNDSTQEADETVNLTLSNPTGGASLGTQATAVLTIRNDDSPDIRGVYALSDDSFLTLASCRNLDNGTFETTGTIDIVTQKGRDFTGRATVFFMNIGDIKLSAPLSGTVNASGELTGTFTFSASFPPSRTIVASGSGTFTGIAADGGLTTNISGRVRSGDTCRISGTLAGTPFD